MHNNAFRTIKIGDLVWVYFTKEHRILEMMVKGIEGEHYEENKYKVATFKFEGEHLYQPHTGSFYINFNEEKSRRGTDFIGFLTKEDGIDYIEEKALEEIDGLVNKVKQIKEDLSVIKGTVTK